MRITLLRSRPEERFKFSIGLLLGGVIAIPITVSSLLSPQYAPLLGYALIPVVIGAALLYKRTFIIGICCSFIAISLPSVIVTFLPSQLTYWHIAAGILWLTALTILGVLYLLREAETRTDAEIDAGWLFRTQD